MDEARTRDSTERRLFKIPYNYESNSSRNQKRNSIDQKRERSFDGHLCKVIMNAAPQLNPSILTKEQLHVLAFALMGELKTMAKAENLLTKNEAAEYLRIDYRTLEKRIKSGVLPARLIHRVEGSIYFLASELHEFVKKS